MLISVQFIFDESLDLTVGSANLAGMSVRVFAFRKRIENDIRTRSDKDLDTIRFQRITRSDNE